MPRTLVYDPLMRQAICSSARLPGWYVALHGELRDLELWCSKLSDPVRAVVTMDSIGPPLGVGASIAPQEDALSELFGPDGIARSFYLTSAELSKASDAREAVFLSHQIVGKLNVDMAMSYCTLPILVGQVSQVISQGNEQHHSFMTSSRLSVSIASRRGLDRNDYFSLQKSEKVEALLCKLNKSDSWENIYKTLELAEYLVGSKKELDRLCSPPIPFKDLRSYANRFRHAVVSGSKVEFTLQRGRGLLRDIVRIALANIQ